jgi:hypothetical protein
MLTQSDVDPGGTLSDPDPRRMTAITAPATGDRRFGAARQP